MKDSPSKIIFLLLFQKRSIRAITYIDLEHGKKSLAMEASWKILKLLIWTNNLFGNTDNIPNRFLMEWNKF
jgi:hypothetical protein